MTAYRTLMQACAILALTGSLSFAQDQPDTKSADKVIADLVNEAVDPYVPGGERSRFLKVAGVDTELDADEFKAGENAEDGFIRSYDRWAAMITFDRSKNGKLDWFEADAYRRDFRARMLAEYDKDKNGKLEGAERDDANKALAAGKLPKATAVTPRPGNREDNPRDPNNPDRPRGGRGNEEMLKRFDKDGDGKLSDDERREMASALILEGRDSQIKKWDENGDGILDDQERSAVKLDPRDRFWLMLDDIGMKHFDENGDGKLSDGESRDIVAFGAKIQDMGKVWEAKLLDTDGDGEVSRDERRDFQQRMQIIGITMLPEAMKWVDTDGDGRPSREELAAVAERAAKRGQEILGDWVKKFDGNGDGRLDANERGNFLDGVNDDIAARIKRHSTDGKLDDEGIKGLVRELAEEFGIKPNETF